jgi:hypothetical protein
MRFNHVNSNFMWRFGVETEVKRLRSPTATRMAAKNALLVNKRSRVRKRGA